jgi:hypothetical protein
MTPEDEKNRQRYFDAMHAVQSAIALDIQISGLNGAGADPKHLRTGVNSCLVDNLAISKLLIEKGIFTESEYFAAIAEAAEGERASLTERMRKRTGDLRISFG